MRAGRECNAAADFLKDDRKFMPCMIRPPGSARRLLDAAGAATATIPTARRQHLRPPWQRLLTVLPP